MKDTRVQGTSYGYVVVPDGGLSIQGVKFPAGPRQAGKSGWYRLLVEAGARPISEQEFETYLKTSEPAPRAKQPVAGAGRKKKEQHGPGDGRPDQAAALAAGPKR